MFALHVAGLGGADGKAAQMGFDAGDKELFEAHPDSFSDDIRSLKNQRYIYKIRSVFPHQHLLCCFVFRKPTTPNMLDV